MKAYYESMKEGLVSDINTMIGAINAFKAAQGGISTGDLVSGKVDPSMVHYGPMGATGTAPGYQQPEWKSPAEKKREYDYEQQYIKDFEAKYGYNPQTGGPPPKDPKGRSGGGTDPAHAAVTQESRDNAVDRAQDTLNSLLAEKKLRQERDDLAKATQT
jgi:hypothetical protein